MNLLLKLLVLLLELPDLVYRMPQVGIVQLGVSDLDLFEMLAGVRKGQERRRLQPSLFGSR